MSLGKGSDRMQTITHLLKKYLVPYLKVQSCMFWDVAGESTMVRSKEASSLGALDVASGFQKELVKNRAGYLALLCCFDIPISTGVNKDW